MHSEGLSAAEIRQRAIAAELAEMAAALGMTPEHLAVRIARDMRALAELKAALAAKGVTS